MEDFPRSEARLPARLTPDLARPPPGRENGYRSRSVSVRRRSGGAMWWSWPLPIRVPARRPTCECFGTAERAAAREPSALDGCSPSRMNIRRRGPTPVARRPHAAVDVPDSDAEQNSRQCRYRRSKRACVHTIPSNRPDGATVGDRPNSCWSTTVPSRRGALIGHSTRPMSGPLTGAVADEPGVISVNRHPDGRNGPPPVPVAPDRVADGRYRRPRPAWHAQPGQ